MISLTFSPVGYQRYGSITNDIVCAEYLLSPDPAIMAFASKPENRDPEDRLACEQLISQLFFPTTSFIERNKSRRKLD